MIDELPRYRKNISSTCNAFIKNWLNTITAPKKLLSNNEREFISDKCDEMCEILV